MKKNLTLALVIAACGVTATFTSCKKGCTDPAANNYNEKAKKEDSDNPCTYDVVDETVITVSSDITTNTTWETGKIYILSSRIAVTSGATLTIEPGVIVKGEAGTGANATALIIAKGSKIMAEGTATQPIIFTSVADQIQPGQIVSPNMPNDLDGLWGGLIVLGNAHVSVASGTSMQIEGIPVSDANGLYGGTDDADNSGVIKYVSIRHGGANIGEGNEINGLTLGGVGSGTVIDHVEIVANQDDGVEFFGGTVSVSDLVVWNCGDDAIDTDQGWNGTVSNFVVINAGDECFELDGPEGTYVNGNHTITAGSVSADGADGLVDNDGNTNVNMDKVFFMNLTLGQDFDQVPTTYPGTFSSFEAVIPAGDAVTDYFLDGSDAWTTGVASATTAGAVISNFATWSWANLDGAMSGF